MAVVFYLTSKKGAQNFGQFSRSIRRVGKLASWLALSAVFDLTLVVLIILQSVVVAFPLTFANIMSALYMREAGYLCRVLFSFSQVFDAPL